MSQQGLGQLQTDPREGKARSDIFSPRLICKAPASPGFEIFCKKKLKKWLVPDSGARMGLGRGTPAPTGSSCPNFQHPEGVGQPGAVNPPARGVNQHFPIATTALRTPQHPGSLPCPIPAWSCMKPLRCDQNPQTKHCSPPAPPHPPSRADILVQNLQISSRTPMWV